MFRRSLAFLIAACSLGGIAQADVLFVDDFSYADGSQLQGQGGWANHSGTVGQILVNGGQITLSDSQSEDVNRNFGTAITSGTVFGAFDFSVSATPTEAGDDFEYFAHFGTGPSSFLARMDVIATTDNGFYRVGLGNGNIAEVVWGSDLAMGTTYRAVIGYDRDTTQATLWIDPTNEASTSITTTVGSALDVDAFYFRQSNSSVNETITVDNLIVATAFSDLTGVPEPTSAGVLGLAALAGCFIRRRRA